MGYANDQHTTLSLGIYILEDELLGGWLTKRLWEGEYESTLLRDLKKHFHKMLMFELIWVERGLAFEAEGNNIYKNLENKGYGNFKEVQKFL